MIDRWCQPLKPNHCLTQNLKSSHFLVAFLPFLTQWLHHSRSAVCFAIPFTVFFCGMLFREIVLPYWGRIQFIYMHEFLGQSINGVASHQWTGGIRIDISTVTGTGLLYGCGGSPISIMSVTHGIQVARFLGFDLVDPVGEKDRFVAANIRYNAARAEYGKTIGVDAFEKLWSPTNPFRNTGCNIPYFFCELCLFFAHFWQQIRQKISTSMVEMLHNSCGYLAQRHLCLRLTLSIPSSKSSNNNYFNFAEKQCRGLTQWDDKCIHTRKVHGRDY